MNVGDLVVIWITGMIGDYIAQVVEAEPLVVKVTETGPWAALRGEDFILQHGMTETLRADEQQETAVFLSECLARKHPAMTGLACLIGEERAARGKVFSLLPPPTEQTRSCWTK